MGPEPQHQRWLGEALESLRIQSRQPDEVLIVSDMAGLPEGMNHTNPYPIRTWATPWRVGVATAFNFGVALAEHECVFMLGSDDWLDPHCLEYCMRDYVKLGRPKDVYFFVGVRYEDDREQKDQFTPCNAAMVTKSLWKATGGFPLEAFAAPDAAFASIFWNRHNICKFVGVNQRRSLYHYRPHEASDTAQRASWQNVILETRNRLTIEWKPPAWGALQHKE